MHPASPAAREPSDLADRAAATARDWFGHGEQAAVEGLPDQLPLGLRP